MKITLYHTSILVTLLFVVLVASGNNVYSLSDVWYDKQVNFQGSTLYNLEKIEKSTKTTVQKEKEVTIEMRDGKMFFNKNVHVLLVDIKASQGIVHLDQGVQIPPSFKKTRTIVQVAQNIMGFLKLAEAVISTKLVSVLNETYQLTVLAPTNAAFEALGTLSEVKMLRNALLLHFIAGEFTFENFIEKHRITTLAGLDVRLIKGNEPLPDRVRVVNPNSKAYFVI